MAFMDEKTFKKHISSKKFNNIYVIFGDEKYLVKFYTKELTTAVAGKESSDFAFHQFSSSASLQEIADSVGTVPFMAEYNCVLIKDFDVNKLTDNEYKSLQEILKAVPISTVLIFSYPTDTTTGAKKGDDKEDSEKKKNRFKSFCTSVDKLGMGAVAEINMRTATSLEHQLVKWADKMGKKLSLPIASKIIYYCSTDLSVLKMELEKICAFAAEEDEITMDMVEATVIKKLEAKVYDMVDSVIYGNANKAYTELHQLFALREDPRGIVRLLGQAFVDLYRARVTVESGGILKETAEFFKYGKRDWVITKAPQKSSKLSTNALRESLSAITDLTAKMNSVALNEEAAVEKLVADLLLIAVKERDYA
ncbi:MAG: DNA polymerase III subunit delta [Ruminococcaceae bacterium]|nr:DNA polymerase III subunit delta [Oscillospiraceae bacterium]